MHQLNDAEVQGDQRTTRKLTALLRNRRKLPAKVLLFHENNRPGYIGQTPTQRFDLSIHVSFSPFLS